MPYSFIEIVRWDEFQHYAKRDPIWIKNYVRLLRDDNYTDLSGHRRGVLHGLWLVYATKRRRLRNDTATLSRELALRVSRPDIQSLFDAGFIGFSDSEALAEVEHIAIPEAEAEKGLVKRQAVARVAAAPEEPPRKRFEHLGSIDERYFAIEALLGAIPGADPEAVRFEAGNLPAATLQKVRESVIEAKARGGVKNLAGYAIAALRSEREERVA